MVVYKIKPVLHEKTVTKNARLSRTAVSFNTYRFEVLTQPIATEANEGGDARLLERLGFRLGFRVQDLKFGHRI